MRLGAALVWLLPLALAAALVLAGCSGAAAGAGNDAAAADPAAADLAAVTPAAAGATTVRPTVVPAAGSAPQVGAEAPDFVLASTGGDTIGLSDLRGRKVLVNFWATWCGPCREEIPLMIDAYGDLQAAGYEILAVNVGETPAKAARFVSDAGMTFPVLMDTSNGVAQAYGLRAIPTTLVVDEDGIVRSIHMGILTADDLDALVAEAGQ